MDRLHVELLSGELVIVLGVRTADSSSCSNHARTARGVSEPDTLAPSSTLFPRCGRTPAALRGEQRTYFACARTMGGGGGVALRTAPPRGSRLRGAAGFFRLVSLSAFSAADLRVRRRGAAWLSSVRFGHRSGLPQPGGRSEVVDGRFRFRGLPAVAASDGCGREDASVSSGRSRACPSLIFAYRRQRVPDTAGWARTAQLCDRPSTSEMNTGTCLRPS